MKRKSLFGGMLVGLLAVTGCETVPPGTERGPGGTIPYEVVIEASEPGAKIEANGQIVGETPLRLTIYGDKDGTFHDFGSEVYVVRALPLSTNQYAQVRMFGTGHWFGPEDRIPQQIHFDMNQKAPEYPGPMAYPYPAPYYYPPPFYYGPSFGFYFDRPYYHHYRHHHHHHGHRHGGLHVRPRR